MIMTNSKNNSQEGGITIMVTLSLLVLLTIAALSMSKNSFKEIKTSGFLRQGAMARNVADSGIQWSIYWIDTGSTTDGTAEKFIRLKNELVRAENPALQPGKMYNVNQAEYKPGGSIASAGIELPALSTNPGFNAAVETNYEQGFTVGLTRMGKLPVTNMSQGAGAGAFTPAAGGSMLQAPDLWAIRSEAQIKPEGASITFTYTKEAWVSTPVR